MIPHLEICCYNLLRLIAQQLVPIAQALRRSGDGALLLHMARNDRTADALTSCCIPSSGPAAAISLYRKKILSSWEDIVSANKLASMVVYRLAEIRMEASIEKIVQTVSRPIPSASPFHRAFDRAESLRSAGGFIATGCERILTSASVQRMEGAFPAY